MTTTRANANVMVREEWHTPAAQQRVRCSPPLCCPPEAQMLAEWPGARSAPFRITNGFSLLWVKCRIE